MEGRVSKPPVGSVVPLSVWGPGPGDWAHGGDAPPESLARPPSTIIRERHGGAKYRCPSGPSQYCVSRRRSHHVGNTGRNHFQRHCDLSFPPSPDSTLGVDGLGGAFGVEPQLRGHRGRWQTWTRHRPRGRADARAAFLPPLTLGPFRPSHRLGADLRFPGRGVTCTQTAAISAAAYWQANRGLGKGGRESRGQRPGGRQSPHCRCGVGGFPHQPISADAIRGYCPPRKSDVARGHDKSAPGPGSLWDAC